MIEDKKLWFFKLLQLTPSCCLSFYELLFLKNCEHKSCPLLILTNKVSSIHLFLENFQAMASVQLQIKIVTAMTDLPYYFRIREILFGTLLFLMNPVRLFLNTKKSKMQSDSKSAVI